MAMAAGPSEALRRRSQTELEQLLCDCCGGAIDPETEDHIDVFSMPRIFAPGVSQLWCMQWTSSYGTGLPTEHYELNWHFVSVAGRLYSQRMSWFVCPRRVSLVFPP